MSLKTIPRTTGRIWQQLTFSDVTPLIKQFSKSPAELSDLEQVDFVKASLAEPTHYLPLDKALPRLRSGALGLVVRAEKRSFWMMFFVHIVDVHFSILAALLSVQVLRTFEKPQEGSWRLVDFYFSSGATLEPGQQWVFAAILASGVFLLNVAAACLHAQKIEREMLLVYRIQMNLTKYLYAFVLRMSRQEKSKIPSGDIVNVAQTDTRHIAEFFAHAFVDFPVLFVSVGVIVALMYTMLGNAAFFGLFLLLLQIPLSLFFSWLGTILHQELMQRSDTRISLVTEWIQGMRLVRYFGWGRKFQAEIKDAAAREFRQEMKLKAKYSLSFALSTSWWMVVCVGVFAGFLFFSQSRTPSQIFAAIWLTAVLGHQLNPLPWFVSIYSESRVGARRLQDVFKCRLQEEEFGAVVPFSEATRKAMHDLQNLQDLQDLQDRGSNLVPSTAPEFICENVTVLFEQSSRPALANVNVVVPAGKVTALVGPVGCGKSVFLQTLMGDVVPTQGRVCVKFGDLVLPLHHPETIAFLQKMQTYVPQEAFVASATLRENVPLRYLDAQDHSETLDNSVMNSLYAASLGVDMGTFPQGLATELGERGVNLSGGQKQRLSMARSAFASARLLFLDDPLSAVDKETEKELADLLLAGHWNKGQTLVWATHRLGFLNLAEHILVLDEGRVVEQGSFEQLTSNPQSRLCSILASASDKGGPA